MHTASGTGRTDTSRPPARSHHPTQPAELLLQARYVAAPAAIRSTAGLSGFLRPLPVNGGTHQPGDTNREGTPRLPRSLPLENRDLVVRACRRPVRFRRALHPPWEPNRECLPLPRPDHGNEEGWSPGPLAMPRGVLHPNTVAPPEMRHSSYAQGGSSGPRRFAVRTGTLRLCPWSSSLPAAGTGAARGVVTVASVAPFYGCFPGEGGA